eukprot:CAMPEP_0175763018 /NCGR_PEP_ID=MMETSP0097-20121207/67516_1 /TAXON_ID=311494 /ORGANISM="Alexandrium monilatum, Strain CCMP3105" /LENGTH=156 /DNA_ID=CAMNT_0017072725 /DNA_START=51 /DNA_END=518 /DNA_ORIENTATION=+
MSKPVVHLFFLHGLAQFLRERNPERCDVLDVGSGSGYLTVGLARVLADAGVEGSVTGMEISEELAQLGATNFAGDAQNASLRQQLHFRHEDACAPSDTGEKYDLIVASAASGAPSLPPGLLAKLRPRGRLIAPVADQGGAQALVAVSLREGGETAT